MLFVRHTIYCQLKQAPAHQQQEAALSQTAPKLKHTNTATGLGDHTAHNPTPAQVQELAQHLCAKTQTSPHLASPNTQAVIEDATESAIPADVNSAVSIIELMQQHQEPACQKTSAPIPAIKSQLGESLALDQAQPVALKLTQQGEALALKQTQPLASAPATRPNQHTLKNLTPAQAQQMHTPQPNNKTKIEQATNLHALAAQLQDADPLDLELTDIALPEPASTISPVSHKARLTPNPQLSLDAIAATQHNKTGLTTRKTQTVKYAPNKTSAYETNANLGRATAHASAHALAHETETNSNSGLTTAHASAHALAHETETNSNSGLTTSNASSNASANALAHETETNLNSGRATAHAAAYASAGETETNSNSSLTTAHASANTSANAPAGETETNLDSSLTPDTLAATAKCGPVSKLTLKKIAKLRHEAEVQKLKDMWGPHISEDLLPDTVDYRTYWALTRDRRKRPKSKWRKPCFDINVFRWRAHKPRKNKPIKLTYEDRCELYMMEQKAKVKKTMLKPNKSKPLSQAQKLNECVHPASTKHLRGFYDWMLDHGFCQRDRAIENLFTIAEWNREHYSKVTSGILPYLSSLVAGDLSDILSDEGSDGVDMMDVVRAKHVLYVALHCMKDAHSGQSLGKLIMSDLAAVAGAINLEHKEHNKVMVFIDEASEVSNEALVQLLNKSRSSNFSIVLATQSWADLTKRTGSVASAQQIMANCNNVISLRVNDPQTASVLAEMTPQTVVSERSASVVVSDNGGLNQDAYTTTRAVAQKSVPLISESMLTLLPDLEFFARMASGNIVKGIVPILQPALQQKQLEDEQAHMVDSFGSFNDSAVKAAAWRNNTNNPVVLQEYNLSQKVKYAHAYASAIALQVYSQKLLQAQAANHDYVAAKYLAQQEANQTYQQVYQHILRQESPAIPAYAQQGQMAQHGANLEQASRVTQEAMPAAATYAQAYTKSNYAQGATPAPHTTLGQETYNSAQELHAYAQTTNTATPYVASTSASNCAPNLGCTSAANSGLNSYANSGTNPALNSGLNYAPTAPNLAANTAAPWQQTPHTEAWDAFNEFYALAADEPLDFVEQSAKQQSYLADYSPGLLEAARFVDAGFQVFSVVDRKPRSRATPQELQPGFDLEALAQMPQKFNDVSMPVNTLYGAPARNTAISSRKRLYLSAPGLRPYQAHPSSLMPSQERLNGSFDENCFAQLVLDQKGLSDEQMQAAQAAHQQYYASLIESPHCNGSVCQLSWPEALGNCELIDAPVHNVWECASSPQEIAQEQARHLGLSDSDCQKLIPKLGEPINRGFTPDSLYAHDHARGADGLSASDMSYAHGNSSALDVAYAPDQACAHDAPYASDHPSALGNPSDPTAPSNPYAPDNTNALGYSITASLEPHYMASSAPSSDLNRDLTQGQSAGPHNLYTPDMPYALDHAYASETATTHDAWYAPDAPYAQDHAYAQDSVGYLGVPSAPREANAMPQRPSDLVLDEDEDGLRRAKLSPTSVAYNHDFTKMYLACGDIIPCMPPAYQSEHSYLSDILQVKRAKYLAQHAQSQSVEHNQPIASSHKPSASQAELNSKSAIESTSKCTAASTNKRTPDTINNSTPEAMRKRTPDQALPPNQHPTSKTQSAPALPPATSTLPQYSWRQWLGDFMQDVGFWSVKGVVALLFSTTLTSACALSLQVGLLLILTMLGSSVVFGFTQWSQWLSSLTQDSTHLGSWLFNSLPEALWQAQWFIDNELGMLSRLGLVTKFYWAHPEILLSLFFSGVLWGHHHSLMSEMRHRSIMGLRQFTHPLGWPWLIVWLISLWLLYSGFILASAWWHALIAIAAMSIGFYTACFNSLRTR